MQPQPNSAINIPWQQGDINYCNVGLAKRVPRRVRVNLLRVNLDTTRLIKRIKP
jgi:hypothetical protein